jgi:BatD DUF11 like domain
MLLASAIGCAMTVGISIPGSAAVRAQIERAAVQTGETLTLNIESDRRGSSDRPDLAPLNQDFDVLGTSSSTEINFVNGSRSDRTRWMVRLQPRHDGVITIPAIKIGDEQTEPLTLTVSDAPPAGAGQAAAHVIVETQPDAVGKSIYVQQQVPYTVRLFYDDAVRAGQLEAPQATDAIVEQLGDEKRYAAMRDGHPYNVIERHYAIAPEKSGPLRIPGAGFRGTAVVASTGQRGDDPADEMMNRLLRNTPFANDPFFRRQLRGGGDVEQPVSTRGRDITIDVQARPAAAIGNWLPAEQVTLHDSWDDSPPQFKAGEPVTRTITVEAKGLAASQVPSLDFGAPANVRLYPEAADNHSRTDGEAVYGTSKQRMTYIPDGQGRLAVPSVTLPWWDVRSNAQVVASIPARDFSVAPGALVSPSIAAPGASTPAVAAAPPSSTPTPNATAQGDKEVPFVERLKRQWQWLAAGMAISAVLAIVGVALARVRRSAGAGSPSLSSANHRRLAMRALRRACAANDRKAAASALLDLGRAVWTTNAPRGLSELAARVEAGRREIMALDRSLYASAKSPWQGSALWEALRNGLHPLRVETRLDDDGLGPLYP